MIEKMNEETKRIYQAVNYEDALSMNYVMNTYLYKSNNFSSNSLSFGKSNLTTLKEIFDFKNEVAFEEKYQEAISGDGNEGRRITTLISSSLCALLHFYNVSKDNPLKIDNSFYDEVHFEVQNKVFDDGKPSNIDVVLISHENEKTKRILFLESKFSEYLALNKSIWIGKKYYSKYRDITGLDDYFHYDIINGKLFFELKNSEKCFMHGIKQLISHYLGICNFISNRSDINHVVKLDDGCEIILATIVFDGWEDKKELINYSTVYHNLANILNNNENKKDKQEKIKVLSKILTYQEVFKDYSLDEKVKKFYRY